MHYLDFGVDTATVPDSVQHVAVTANTLAVIRARLFAGIYAGNLTFKVDISERSVWNTQ